MGCTDQEPDRDQRQRHVMMPAFPGTYLILVHACFPLASLKAGFNAGASLDDPRQFPKRRLLELRLGPTCRREIILVTVAGVLISGIPRGTGLPRPVVHEGTTGDDQPLLGPCPFMCQARLDTAFDHLNRHWTSYHLSTPIRQIFTPSARPAHDEAGWHHSMCDDATWPSGYAAVDRQCCVRPGHAAVPSPATPHRRC